MRLLQQSNASSILNNCIIPRDSCFYLNRVCNGQFSLMLSSFNLTFYGRLIRRPREYIVALRDAASECAQNADASFIKILKQRQLQVGFEGNFGANLVSPRGLLSKFLNNLVEVEGIVTKGSSVQPKLVTSVQFCAATSVYRVLEHRDDTSSDLGIEDNGKPRLPTNGMLAKEDAEGNPLELEQGLSTYKDYQTIVLQEMPERAKVGQLPRSIELMLEYDLVDKVKPGDRVKCVGVYQPLAPPVMKGQCSGFFKPVLICNNISVIGKEVGAVQLTASDVKNIKYVMLCVCGVLSRRHHSFGSTTIQMMMTLLILSTHHNSHVKLQLFISEYEDLISVIYKFLFL